MSACIANIREFVWLEVVGSITAPLIEVNDPIEAGRNYEVTNAKLRAQKPETGSVSTVGASYLSIYITLKFEHSSYINAR
jgi:hypothetical protein